jgi:hypothetical protein
MIIDRYPLRIGFISHRNSFLANDLTNWMLFWNLPFETMDTLLLWYRGTSFTSADCVA